MRDPVLLIEDNADHADEVIRELESRHDYEIVHVRSLAQARSAVAVRQFPCMIVDYRLPDGSGIRLARELRHNGFGGTIILVTAVMQESIAREAFENRIDDVVIKTEAYGPELAALLAARRNT